MNYNNNHNSFYNSSQTPPLNYNSSNNTNLNKNQAILYNTSNNISPFQPFQIPNSQQVQIVPMEEDDDGRQQIPPPQQQHQHHANQNQYHSQQCIPNINAASSHKRSFDECYNEDATMSSDENCTSIRQQLKRFKINHEAVIPASNETEGQTETTTTTKSMMMSRQIGINDHSTMTSLSSSSSSILPKGPQDQDQFNNPICSSNSNGGRKLFESQEAENILHSENNETSSILAPTNAASVTAAAAATTPFAVDEIEQQEEEIHRSVTPFIDPISNSSNGCYNNMNQMLGMLHRARRGNHQQQQQQQYQQHQHQRYTTAIASSSIHNATSAAASSSFADDDTAHRQYHHQNPHFQQQHQQSQGRWERRDHKGPSVKRQIKLQTDSKLK